MTASPTPEAERSALQDLLNGYRNTALLYVAARLGIAEALANGPRAADEIARKVGAHEPSLHRVLRGLATMNVLAEEADGRFRLTPMGALLAAGVPGSLHASAILCGEEYFAAWGGLLHTVRTGATAFDHVFGMTPWEHRAQSPELNASFNDWLAGATAEIADAIARAGDFGRFPTIADIGGGNGALLAAVLRHCPQSHGVLFDQPHVAPGAEAFLESAGVASRSRVASGDFFARIDVRADAFVLKSVLHDWDDERCRTILENCRAAMDGTGARLILVERILPRLAVDDPRAVMIDLHMMAVTGGRERTTGEYDALLESCGFSPRRTTATSVGFHLIEATPV